MGRDKRKHVHVEVDFDPEEFARKTKESVKDLFSRIGKEVSLTDGDAGAEAIYLHVERSNEAALQLYRAEEYNTLPESPVYTSFTSALKLQHREPLLLRKSLIG